MKDFFNLAEAKRMMKNHGVEMFGNYAPDVPITSRDHKIWWDEEEQEFMYLGTYEGAEPELARGVFNQTYFKVISSPKIKGIKPWMG